MVIFLKNSCKLKYISGQKNQLKISPQFYYRIFNPPPFAFETCPCKFHKLMFRDWDTNDSNRIVGMMANLCHTPPLHRLLHHDGMVCQVHRFSSSGCQFFLAFALQSPSHRSGCGDLDHARTSSLFRQKKFEHGRSKKQHTFPLENWMRKWANSFELFMVTWTFRHEQDPATKAKIKQHLKQGGNLVPSPLSPELAPCDNLTSGEQHAFGAFVGRTKWTFPYFESPPHTNKKRHPVMIGLLASVRVGTRSPWWEGGKGSYYREKKLGLLWLQKHYGNKKCVGCVRHRNAKSDPQSETSFGPFQAFGVFFAEVFSDFFTNEHIGAPRHTKSKRDFESP